MNGTITVGFFGKLPARGDFVQAGLPRGFTDPWDGWLQEVLRGSRAVLGDSWLDAWLEAPVWRFALPPGMSGVAAVLGLMLPSVDRVGRYFPLTFAALCAPGGWPEPGAAEAWLDACEQAGRAALERDLDPEGLASALGTPLVVDAGPPETALWWTEGGPRVPPSRLTLPELPDAATFAAMLDAASRESAAWPRAVAPGR